MITSSTPALQVDDLRKNFGAMPALRGVSLHVEPAERLALLGPNGAGKTTLIRSISGRTKPDAGTMLLFGEPMSRNGVRQSLGLVPQEIAVYSDLTTRENLTAFARFHGLPRREVRRRVDWALQWTGLIDRADELVGGFSGGMKRRVNLACGVMHAPRILLLDEPTVGVDPQSRERIIKMLDELNEHGTAILLTTHHLDEAQHCSDRIVIMDKGLVVAEGTLNELIDRTVGSSRLVQLRIDQPLSSPLPSPTSSARSIGKIGDEVLSTRINNVSSELPSLIDSLRRNGYFVRDVEVQAPSLHHVFLHLTGHELRD